MLQLTSLVTDMLGLIYLKSQEMITGGGLSFCESERPSQDRHISVRRYIRPSTSINRSSLIQTVFTSSAVSVTRK